MGRKLGLTSLFSLGDATSTARPSSSSWAWPSCKQHPRTESFRAVDGSVYKTANTIYFDSTDCSFTRSSEDNNSESLSTSDNDDPENLIRGLVGSDRLFFEPGSDTRSILGSGPPGVGPFKESVAMAMESDDPYFDFKKSMEEMVAAHGANKDWEYLEELLVWYLKMNGKTTHGYIVGAFVDLMVGIAANDDAHGDDLPSSSSSSSSSCCGSSLSLSTSRNCYEIEEVEEGSASS